MEYNYEQLVAIESDSKNIVVVAGPGSGKTATITGRINFLLDKKNIPPEDIYALTYTNSAAQELLKRINKDGVFVGTIHSLANKILLKNEVDTGRAIENEDFDSFFTMITKQGIKIPRIPFLLVDEFQDITEKEYRFIFEILKPESFFIVGDSRQSIYSFRGSNYQLFEKLITDGQNQVYELNINYRNPKAIMKFANKFIAGMEDIWMTEVECESFVLGTIEKHEFSGYNILQCLKSDLEYNNWFILCRTNRQVDLVMEILEDKGIPCETFKKGNKRYEDLTNSLKNNTVKVLTIHSAKGLEAKNVIVIGANSFSPEEKRLSFVAATRAKEHLFWFKKP